MPSTAVCWLTLFEASHTNYSTVKQAVDYILAQPDGTKHYYHGPARLQRLIGLQHTRYKIHSGLLNIGVMAKERVDGGCPGDAIYISPHVQQSPGLASCVIRDRKWMLPKSHLLNSRTARARASAFQKVRQELSC